MKIVLPGNNGSVPVANELGVLRNADINLYRRIPSGHDSVKTPPPGAVMTMPYNYQWQHAFLQGSWDMALNASLTWFSNNANQTNLSYASIALQDRMVEFHLFRQLTDLDFERVQTSNYVWGFSSAWVAAAGLSTALWVLGTWIFWADADHNGKFCRKGRRMGPYRAALDVASNLDQELGPDTGAYSEERLEREAWKMRPVKYYVEEPFSLTGKGKIGLSAKKSPRVRLRWDQEYE